MKTLIGVSSGFKSRLTHKEFEQAIANNFPEKCGCGTSRLFEVRYRSTGIGESVIVVCQDCKKEFDVTPYDYW